MNSPKSKTNIGPSEVRGISDPPDMGQLKPAEEVAKDLIIIDRHGARVQDALDQAPILYGEQRAPAMRGILERLIRQSRAEGAAAALEEMAGRLEAKASGYSASASDAWTHEASSERYGGKFEAYDDAATILRARIKSISDPPDMG